MSGEKNDENKDEALQPHGAPVAPVEPDPSASAPNGEPYDPTVFHPRRHRGGVSVGVPDVPNLSPGGDVEIKR